MSDIRPNKTDRCAVCGDLSTGYHYNVLSCNGCKAFFRRTIIMRRVFKCQKDDNCPINESIRCMCRACRYRKCVQVGMNPRAIKPQDKDQQIVEPTSLLYGANLLKNDPRSSTNSKLLSDLQQIEESLEKLRSSSIPTPSILLDVLTRPSALLTTSLSPSLTSTIISMDLEAFSILEYVKAFSWFCELSFSDKYCLLHDRATALLALRMSWHRAGTAFSDQFSVLLAPVIDSIRELTLDQTTLSLLSVLLLSENYDLSLSSEAKIILGNRNETYSTGLASYLFQKFGLENANRVAQHFFLLWTTMRVGSIVKDFLKKTEPENSLCRQIVEIEKCY